MRYSDYENEHMGPDENELLSLRTEVGFLRNRVESDRMNRDETIVRLRVQLAKVTEERDFLKAQVSDLDNALKDRRRAEKEGE